MPDNQDEFIFEDRNEQEPKPQAQSRIVSPTRGFYWLEKALSDIVIPHFGKWFVAGLLYSVLLSASQVLHPYAAMLVNLLGPIFIAGGLLGAHQQKQSQQAPSNYQFFSAFTHISKLHLVLLIVVQIVIFTVFTYLMFNAIGVEALQSIDWQKVQAQQDQAYLQQVMSQLLPYVKWVIIFGFFYSLLNWFVISLIVFSGQNVFAALANSFIAAIKNIGAVLIFIIITIVIALVLGIILSLIMAAISPLAPQIISLAVSTLLTAIIMPIIAAILYVSYREVFFGEIEASSKSL
ncbi:BPSS1780 family membrane protein [Kangiella sp. TOML190]|uniref:BPSS1780 family membrane protein n=1 Tax=Kangiella sp. TOML190 TaxID=2931351 RepID=UPI0020421E12|nr:BPSS1780 family membrane protein [Kangiella sp. TOML190]